MQNIIAKPVAAMISPFIVLIIVSHIGTRGKALHFSADSAVIQAVSPTKFLPVSDGFANPEITPVKKAIKIAQKESA